tara:strand:- start:5787 stop:5996 length:210 start_codon:yes stop_codon:yes gene_type:complete
MVIAFIVAILLLFKKLNSFNESFYSNKTETIECPPMNESGEIECPNEEDPFLRALKCDAIQQHCKVKNL